MRIAMFKARCGACNSEFSYPDDGDFNYGSFIFTGEQGSVFAHLDGIGHPVWDFVKSTLTPDPLAKKNSIFEVCAFIADKIDGQGLVDHKVCSACQSANIAAWRIEQTGVLDIPEVTFKAFMAKPESDRRRILLAYDVEHRNRA